MEKLRLKVLYGWFFLFVIIIIITLSGCGSLRVSSINEYDDIHRSREANRIENINIRDDIKTDMYENISNVNALAFTTLEKDAKGSSGDNGKYKGVISTPYTRNDNVIKYEITLNGETIAVWQLPGGMTSIKFLPIGQYQVIGYKRVRDIWKIKGLWSLKVTNKDMYDGYHFRLNGFEQN